MRAYFFRGKVATDVPEGFSEFIRFSWTPSVAVRSGILPNQGQCIVLVVACHGGCTSTCLVLLLVVVNKATTSS